MKLRNKVGYGFGDLGISIAYFAVGFFFIFYLTDGIGMRPIVAGIVFFIGQLWDSINDPIMGIISDRTKSKHGRKRVYLLFGAIPFSISFVLLWIIPINVSPAIQFILATAAILFHTTAYTVVAVPYMSLVPMMTKDYDERTSIVGIRAMLSTLGTIGGAGAALFVSGDDTINLGNLHTMAIVFGIVSIFALLISAQSVKGIHDDSSFKSQSFSDYVKIIKNSTVRLLLSVKFLGAIGTGTLSASIVYYATYVLGDSSYSTYGLGIYIIVTAACIPFYNYLTKRVSKQKILLVTNFATAIILSYMGFFVDSNNLTMFFVSSALLGMFMSAYLLIPYSIIPDLVEIYEYETGDRHESVFFGLWSSFHSLGIAFAGLLLTSILDIMKYDGTKNTQTTQGLLGIKIGFGILPGIFLILTAITLSRYKVTRVSFGKIVNSLTG
ncbi:MAG: MFS transporter [Candidatus Heimdallarchaeota archaeon]|nr:MFS transporter [Candidatus Heimdallarchaeota archaeon]